MYLRWAVEVEIRIALTYQGMPLMYMLLQTLLLILIARRQPVECGM
jgi:hypothetical protein